ncbi:hypothetical protein I9W82_005510 [Candida metapsilosis]|uniref:Uncharacterized protein n=1 Tax=Candida metapsilosis TaxID=273372 RepID=A0A8H8D9F0_9ASCO|nr:hypothetical protein I9W82_005510 [Candida metapsilosis]
MLRDDTTREQTSDETLFRARILRHFSDINRLQNHFNRLVNRDGSSNTSLELNNIPLPLRNLSRELSHSRRREAYFVESSGEEDDEGDQSFHYEDDANTGLEYYSNDDNIEDESSDNDVEALGSLMEEADAGFEPNQRLLLRTARSPQVSQGIPLRRQNAIRIRSMLNEENNQEEDKRGGDSTSCESLEKEAESLQKEIHSILKTIEKTRKESFLFPTNLHKPFSVRYFASLKNHMQGCSLDGKCGDLMMDEFLWKRVNKMLFLEKILPPPPPPSTKKRTISEKGPSKYKRQKTNHRVEKNSNDFSIPPGYPYLNIDKHKLLDGLCSSCFQSGSHYRASLDSCSGPNFCDIKFTNVGSNVEGVFCLEPEGNNLESLLLKLQNFAKFFCGMSNDACQLPDNEILIRKLNVLDRLSVDDKVHFNKLNVCSKLVPFGGRVVDFKTNDLRFLNSEKPHSARFKSNKVKVQLTEWMKINPFIQFKQTFFHDFLQHLDQDLKHFSEIKSRKSRKTEALHLTKVFKSSIPEITKNYFSPVSDKIGKRRIRGGNDIFIEDWERNLVSKLVDIITKEDCDTLINLQLNYTLFTLEVDISKYLDTFINTILDHGEGEYIESYRKVYNNILKDETEDIKAILLCSINKKTGKLEIHNTFPHLRHGRHIARWHCSGIVLTTNPLMNSTGNTIYVYDDFDLFEKEPAPVNSKTFNKRFFNKDWPEDAVDKLTGYVTSSLPIFDTL